MVPRKQSFDRNNISLPRPPKEYNLATKSLRSIRVALFLLAYTAGNVLAHNFYFKPLYVSFIELILTNILKKRTLKI